MRGHIQWVAPWGLCAALVAGWACGGDAPNAPGAALVVDSITPSGTAAVPWPVVTVYFSHAVEPATVTNATLRISRGGVDLFSALAPSGDGRSVRITAPLLPAQTYTVSVGTGLRSTAGDTLAAVVHATLATRSVTPISIGTDATVSTQHMAVDAHGRLHVLQMVGSGNAVRYGACDSACGLTSSWHVATIDNGSLPLETAGFAVDVFGDVHTVYYSGTSHSLRYAICQTVCTTDASWQSGVADSRNNTGLFSAMVVDTLGRLYSLYTDRADGMLYSGACVAACRTPTNWSTGALPSPLTNMQDLALALDASGQLHAMYRGGSGSANSIVYATCTTGCTTTANWQSAVLESPTFPGSGSALLASPAGALTHAYYVGQSGVRYATCPSGCLSSANWVRTDVDPSASGVWVALARDASARVAIAYADAGGGLELATCTQGCELATHWQHAQVDATVNAGLYPALVFDSNGQLHLAYAGPGGRYLQ